MKLGVGRLRDDLIEDFEVWVCPNPVRNGFAEELALPRLGG